MTHAKRTLAIGAATATAALATALAGIAPASASPAPHHTPLEVRAILSGSAHGWTDPDDLTRAGSWLFVAFQNGVPSTGGAAGTPQDSTVVEFNAGGHIRRTWQVTGKVDGLTADPSGERVFATVNEDGNSSLYTIATRGDSGPVHYSYDLNPLPHGGGTDALSFLDGKLYISASAPTTTGPAVYQVRLERNGVAHIAAEPIADNSTATVANPGGRTVTLALTDPDSNTVVPASVPRFGGDFMLDSQGDQEQIYASRLGTPRQRLSVLSLSQSVDDTAFPTRKAGFLLASNQVTDSVDLIAGSLAQDAAYAAVTPGDANTPPVPTPPNYLGEINLRTGVVTPVTTSGADLEPTALLYVADAH